MTPDSLTSTNFSDWQLDEENDAIYSEKKRLFFKGRFGTWYGDGRRMVEVLTCFRILGQTYTEAKQTFYAPASLLVPFPEIYWK